VATVMYFHIDMGISTKWKKFAIVSTPFAGI
jgi:hypothetical protein